MRPFGEDPGLGSGQAHSFDSPADDCHRQKGHGDSLAGREQHVHLPRRWVGGDRLGQFDQFVGGVPHGRDHHHHLVAGLSRGDDPVGYRVDSLRVSNRGAAVFLNDERQERSKSPGGLPLDKFGDQLVRSIAYVQGR